MPHDLVHLVARQRKRACACDENDIVSVSDHGTALSERRPDYAPNTVAADGVCDLFAGGDAYAAVSRTVTHNICNECGTDNAFSSSVKAPEIPVFLQSVFQDNLSVISK